MTFDELMKANNPKYSKSDDTVELRLLRGTWNAAIEQAAMMVGKRGAEPGEMQPESIAREIRMMRSNG